MRCDPHVVISSTTASANPSWNDGVNANLRNVGGASAEFWRVFVRVLITPGDTPLRYRPSNATSRWGVKFNSCSLIPSSISKTKVPRAKYFNLANETNDATGNLKTDSSSTSFTLSILNTESEPARISSGTLSQSAPGRVKVKPKEQRFVRNPSIELNGVLRCTRLEIPLQRPSSGSSTSLRRLTWVPRYGFNRRRR